MKKVGKDWFTLDADEIKRYDRPAGGLSKIPGIDYMVSAHDVVRVDLHRSHFPLFPGLDQTTEQNANHTKNLANRDWFRPFQLEAIQWIRERSGCILALDLGGGKTSTATGASTLPVAVFVPLSVIDVWKDECARLGWTYHLCREVEPFKAALKAGKTDCFIVPYSRAHALAGYFRGISLGTLIADEAHVLTNKYVTWASEFRGIPRQNTILLTATPMRNRLASLWGLLDSACPKSFGYQYQFRQRYCGAVPSPYGGLIDNGRTHQDELAKRLTEVIFKRTRASMKIPLPMHHRLLLTLEIPERIPSLDELLKTLYRPVGAQLTIATKLRQHISLKKAQHCNVAEIQGKHPRVIWWIWYHETANVLEQRLKALGLEVDMLTGEAPTKKRSRILEQWKDAQQVGRPRALVASISAAGAGIALANANAAVFVDLDWTPLNLIQAEKRHHRFGSHLDELWTYYLRVPGTIDDLMAEALTEKQEDSEASLGVDGTVAQMRALLGQEDQCTDEAEIMRRLANKLLGR